MEKAEYIERLACQNGSTSTYHTCVYSYVLYYSTLYTIASVLHDNV